MIGIDKGRIMRDTIKTRASLVIKRVENMYTWVSLDFPDKVLYYWCKPYDRASMRIRRIVRTLPDFQKNRAKLSSTQASSFLVVLSPMLDIANRSSS